MATNRNMFSFIVLLVTLFLPASACAADTVPSTAAASITQEELRGHVYFLADDALGGRGTGSDGYNAAAEYSASQFRGAGCRPLLNRQGGEPSYFQPFRLLRSRSGREIKHRLLDSDDDRSGKNVLETSNVVAWVEGSDAKLKSEYVVVGAHLDHLGTRRGEIFNGADDNASGTAAVLEIAEAVAMAPPRRSVVFALFSAEEIGLHGSSFFVEHPPVPVEKIVANINLDMIGRPERIDGGTFRIYIVGSDRICDEMKNLVTMVNDRSARLELDFKGAARYFAHSDHLPFHEAGIPVAFLFDNMEEDFHEPRDDADRIDFEGMKRVTGLAFELLMECADADSAPCSQEATERTSGN